MGFFPFIAHCQTFMCISQYMHYECTGNTDIVSQEVKYIYIYIFLNSCHQVSMANAFVKHEHYVHSACNVEFRVVFLEFNTDTL